MNDLESRLAATLRRYLSDILAQSLKTRAITAAGAVGPLTAERMPEVCQQLRSGIRLFVDPALQPALLRELDALGSATAVRPQAERHPLRGEGDISLVRVRAREIAQALGATALGVQRVATAASELARNVVSYAGHGVLELVPEPDRAAITLRAIDQGPGIADLALVLSGKYRSRTGLGKGLLGVKRLSTRFDVQSSSSGTRVEAEIAL